MVRRYALLNVRQEQQYFTYNQHMTPYLFKQANYIQLANAQMTAPGTGGNKQPELPLGVKSDHSNLLRDSSFLGIVALNLQEHNDVIRTVTLISTHMRELVEEIDEYLND